MTGSTRRQKEKVVEKFAKTRGIQTKRMNHSNPIPRGHSMKTMMTMTTVLVVEEKSVQDLSKDSRLAMGYLEWGVGDESVDADVGVDVARSEDVALRVKKNVMTMMTMMILALTTMLMMKPILLLPLLPIHRNGENERQMDCFDQSKCDSTALMRKERN